MKKKEYAEARMIMEKPRVKLTADKTLEEAANVFFSCTASKLPVLDKSGHFIGILEAKQVLEALCRNKEAGMPILEMVKTDIERVDINATLNVEKILFHGEIYVCDNEQLAGVISLENLVNLYSWKLRLMEKFEEKCKEYELVFDNIYDSIYDISADNVVLMANPATQRITGKTPADVIGQKLDEIEEKKIYFPSVVHRVREKASTVTILQNVRNDKKAVVTGVPVFDEKGELQRIVATTRDVAQLIESLEGGITEDLQKTLDKLKTSEELVEQYFAEIRQLRSEQEEERRISTNNKEMKNILDMIKRVAPVDSSVLILGESGVGKDLLANMIHNMSNRRNKPFVKINCGAIPENILESELFGYEPGAFTGAQKNGKLGLLEIANEGTVFLNEIGELPANLQVKLLQAIQDRSFMRLGGFQQIHVDIRIISATNCNLADMVKKNTFREDLFYRLNVIPVTIPPLRQRREDIPDLTMLFMDRFNAKYSRKKQLASASMELLINYDWPGNVRELENLIERVMVVSRGDIIYPIDFPAEMHQKEVRKPESEKGFTYQEGEPLESIVERLEKEVLEKAYRQYGTTTKVAEALDVNQSTIARKIRKYNIAKP